VCVYIYIYTTIKALSEAMATRLVDVIKAIIKLGDAPETIMDPVKMETAELVVTEFGMVYLLLFRVYNYSDFIQ
jgi:hypothetical protein